MRVAASDRRQTIQVISTNYTCHRLVSVSLGFPIGLRGAAPVADETTPSTAAKCQGRRGPKEVTQYSSSFGPFRAFPRIPPFVGLQLYNDVTIEPPRLGDKLKVIKLVVASRVTGDR